MTFTEQWLQTVESKNSLLCVNIDPAEPGQRQQSTLPAGESKLNWTLKLIASVAPFCAAIKPNRQYFKDLSRREMLEINGKAHDLGLLSIDDSKISDIGDTNDAALYHAVEEGFDAITYAPFPGNIAATCRLANQRGIGLIPLSLMSNPEYLIMKNLPLEGQPAYLHIANQAVAHKAQGIVVGAPSPSNHISQEELAKIKDTIGDSLTVLVPGIGAQGGDLEPIVSTFGDRAIVSVGRDIAYADNPADRAAFYNNLINHRRKPVGSA